MAKALGPFHRTGKIVCGIAGYLNLNGYPLDPDPAVLKSMCQSLGHRGPDEEGHRIMGPVALGMTRLSIIDLKTGKQPIGNEDGSVWIVFNGEIYNFQELQERLLAHGHRLSTRTDTETIVHLYEEYGVDCLRFLEGQFAFALWDHERQRLFIARDRMGEKPLHWGCFDGQFIFGSELKGLLAHPGVKREPDMTAVQKYLALEYVPAPSSIFQGIHKLMPAHYLLVERGQVRSVRYWQPEIFRQNLSETDAVDKVTELLTRSTRLCMISDVPLGVFLSGGIDSSTIAALASRLGSEPVKTFSIGFQDPSFDETESASLVASHLGCEHNVVQFEPTAALNAMEELWETLDEPLADASIIPTFFLSKMTRRQVTVALAGEGGDELFGGYPTYQAHRMVGLWRLLPTPLRRGLLEPAIRHLPVSLSNLSLDYKAKRFIQSSDEPPIRRHLRWMGSIPVSDHERLIQEHVITTLKEEEMFPGLVPRLSPGQDFGQAHDVVSKIMHMDLVTYLPDDLLVKSDRASMAASLEVRLPFLSYPLVEFALSLPSSMKLRGLTTKYLLKKVAAPYLPAKILRRPKKGFGIPVAKWLGNEFRPLVNELLEERFVKRQGIFYWPFISSLIKEHDSGYRDRRKELWTLLMFQCWWRKYFAYQ